MQKNIFRCYNKSGRVNELTKTTAHFLVKCLVFSRKTGFFKFVHHPALDQLEYQRE